MNATQLLGLVPAFLAQFVAWADTQTLWFVLSVLLVACISGQLMYLWRANRNRRRELADLREEVAYWKNLAGRAQANLLNEQLNPHFLFNNLGSLSTLIEEDQPAAVHFVEELAGIYRYVLEVYNLHLTTLKDEIALLNSYYHLLQIRFGQNLHLDIEVPQEYGDYQLPPLTLQLLVENAVKHNIITTEKPLYVSVRLKENKLVVENNIQLKAASLFSGKIGLQHIREKYKWLEAGEIEVLDSGSAFRVTVPLIS